MFVYHGTTIENKESILLEGLRANSYVGGTLALAMEWARVRGLERGSDDFVIFEVDVPEAAVVEMQSWWWAEGQKLLPFGAPPSDLRIVTEEELQAERAKLTPEPGSVDPG